MARQSPTPNASPEPRLGRQIVNWSRAGWAGALAAPAALVGAALAAKIGLGGDAGYLAGAVLGGMAVGAALRNRRA